MSKHLRPAADEVLRQTGKPLDEGTRMQPVRLDGSLISLGLPDGHVAQLITLSEDAATAYMRSPELRQAIVRGIRNAVDKYVADIIGDNADAWQAQVRAIVAEKWDEQVQAAAQRVMAEALEAVRKKVCP